MKELGCLCFHFNLSLSTAEKCRFTEGFKSKTWQSIFYGGCYWRFALWSVVEIRGMGNVRTRILKFTFFIKERKGQFVGVAGVG